VKKGGRETLRDLFRPVGLARVPFDKASSCQTVPLWACAPTANTCTLSINMIVLKKTKKTKTKTKTKTKPQKPKNPKHSKKYPTGREKSPVLATCLVPAPEESLSTPVNNVMMR